MGSIVVWAIGITVSIVLLVLSAGAYAPYVHMSVAAVMAVLFSTAAISDTRRMRAEGMPDAAIASANARFMGLVWTWGALGLFVTYNFVLEWKEWLHFFLAFFVVAGLCLFFSATLRKDADAGRYDPAMRKIGRILTMVQVGGMVITVLGLLIDGKMTRFLTPRYTDWAANNLFFFGALALIVIGVHALLTSREPSQGSAT